MKSYAGYLIASYAIVFICLGSLLWVSIKRWQETKKQIREHCQDLSK